MTSPTIDSRCAWCACDAGAGSLALHKVPPMACYSADNPDRDALAPAVQPQDYRELMFFNAAISESILRACSALPPSLRAAV